MLFFSFSFCHEEENTEGRGPRRGRPRGVGTGKGAEGEANSSEERRRRRQRGAILLSVPFFRSHFHISPSFSSLRASSGTDGTACSSVPSTQKLEGEGRRRRFARGSNVLFLLVRLRFFGSTFFLSLFPLHSLQASRASSELDEAYASVHSWIDEVSREWWKEGEKVKCRASAAIELSLTPTSTTNETKKTPNAHKVPRLRGPRGRLPGALPGRAGL